MNSENRIASFYSNIGNILYSVAACDKVVQKEEILNVRKLLQKDWLIAEKSLKDLEEDSAQKIQNYFYSLLEQSPDPQECFNEFKAFYESNKDMFSKTINDWIINTTSAIAFSFSKNNKSELVMLSKIQILLTQK
ncbi:MAG: hypothetical protein HOP11_04295 [Saprospiraceae bacterium]|nr:hypothetical protein [Saprospiraceae bacterium]